MTSGAQLSSPSRRPRVTVPHIVAGPTVGATGPAPAVVELAVRGPWSHPLGLDVSARLRDCLAQRPGVVIVDLHAMTDDHAASLPLWLAARRAAAVLRPPVRLALCLPTTTVLHTRLRRIGAHRLPMYTTMLEARTAMAAPSHV